MVQTIASAAQWRLRFRRAAFVLVCVAALLVQPVTLRAANLDALLREGSQALAGGDYATAENSFRAALSLQPNSIEILNNLALSLARQKRQGEAIALYLKALRQKPGDPITSHNLAMAYFRDGQYARALPVLRTIAAAQPSFAADSLVGQSLFALGRNTEAAAWLEQASQLNPADLPTLDLLGKAYYQSKQYGKVNDVFRRVVAINPDSAEAHLLLALAYDKEHQDDKAEQEYRAAAVADPSAMGVHSGLALLYWRKGKTAEAASEFRSELRTYPADNVANRYLGEILRKDNQPAVAIPHLQAALKSDATDKTAWFELGKCEAMVNHPDKAVPALRQAIRLDPNYYQAHFVLGAALKKLGQSAAAAEEQRTAERIQAQESTRLVHDISK